MHVNSLCAMIVDFAYIKNRARCKIKYSCRSAVRIPGWSRQFWANYCPVFPIGIIFITVLLLLILYTVRYCVSALRGVSLAKSNDFYALFQHCEKRLLAPSCQSVRPHGTTRLPLEMNFLMGAGIFLYLIGSVLST
jgi:hypothetical protein